MQAAVIDALLEIDAHDAERRQRAAPIVARIDVFGADLADGLVHGVLCPKSVILGVRAKRASKGDGHKLEAVAPRGSAEERASHLRVTGYDSAMSAFVYMLRCVDGSYYVGSATGDDLERRSLNISPVRSAGSTFSDGQSSLSGQSISIG